MAKLIVDSKADKQISGDDVEVKKKEVEEKDVSEGTFPFDDTKKEVTVHQREEIQISCDAVDFESKEVSVQKMHQSKRLNWTKWWRKRKMSVKPQFLLMI